MKYLLECQTSDELTAGTSIHRNGVGLSRLDAQAVADRGVPNDPELLHQMVCKYSTQLGHGVSEGLLRLVDLPDDDATTGHAQNAFTESESESEPEHDERDGALVTRFGIISEDRIVVPSRSLKAMLLSISIQLSSACESEDSDVPPWQPEDVMVEFNERERHFGTTLDMRSVDDALFHTIPEGATEVGQWIRVYWSSEGRWVTCRVDRVEEKMGVNRTLYVTFHDEDGNTGVLTGDDTHMVYALRPGGQARVVRRRKRRVLGEEREENPSTDSI
jgi:hypothetical protein